MAEVYPEDPRLATFAARYSAEGFDPTAVRIIISPSKQMRPRGASLMQSIEQPTPIQNSPRPQYAQEVSPRPQYLQATNSPKRPFQADNEDLNPPRKLARGESPLKGAAGRRLDQQKRLQGTPSWTSNAPPFVVPRDITFLLSIIPRAELYTSTKFSPEALVKLLRETIVPDFRTWKAARDESQPPTVQRYDGMRSHNPLPPRPTYPPHPQQQAQPQQQYYPPTPQNHQIPNSGGYEQSWQPNSEYQDQNQYAGYLPSVPHQRESFSGSPPVMQQGFGPASTFHMPEPTRSGFHAMLGNGNGFAEEGHVKADSGDTPLVAAAGWYYGR